MTKFEIFKEEVQNLMKSHDIRLIEDDGFDGDGDHCDTYHFFVDNDTNEVIGNISDLL
jgi:hypothetical protein